MQIEGKNILILCGTEGKCLFINKLKKMLQKHFNVITTGILKTYTANLKKESLDCVVLCDFSKRGASQKGIIKNFHKIPHVLITDKSQEKEIQFLLSKGLKDYILSKNTTRLVPAINREINAFFERKNNKQIFKDLKKSKEELALHLQNAPLATISWDIDFRVTQWNKAAVKLFGYAVKEAMGKSCLELLTPKHLKVKAKSLIAALIKQKGETDNINETLTKSGEILICHWYNTIIKNEKGVTLSIVSTIEDVTQQELANRQLRKQQRLLEHAQKLSEVYFIDINLEKNEIILDQEFIKLCGLPPKKKYLSNYLLSNLVHPKDGIKLLKAYKKTINEDVKFAVDIRVIYADGTVRWVNIFADKFVDEITNINSLVGTFIDVTDRNIEILKLEKQNHRLDLAVNIAQIGFIDFNYKTGIVETFGKTNQIFDLDKQKNKFEFKEFFNRIHPDDAAKVDEALELSKTGKKPFKLNHRLLLPNGDTIWVNALGEVAIDKKNKSVKLLGITRDITSQVTRERRLLQHSLILNQINSLVLVMDNKNDLIFASPTVNKLTGYTINEILGQGWQNKSHVSEEDKNTSKNHFSSFLETPKKINNLKYERKVRCKDGSVKWFSWQFSRGTENTVICLAHDITTEKEKEYLVTKLFKALENSPTIVMITDIQGTIEYVNPKFEEATGYSSDEVIGKNPRILKTGFTTEEDYRKLWKTITNGDTWAGEFKNRKKDGGIFWESAIITPVKDAEGVITNFIALKEDITEKKAQEKNFLYALFEAQEREKLKFGEELHDSLSQILSAMSFYLDAVLNPKNKKDHLKIEYLKKVRKLSEDALRESRHISHGLMSKQLLKGGLLSAIEEICANYNISKKIKFKFEQSNFKESLLSAQTTQNVYRIIQEMSTNIVRHSQATEAKITFKIDSEWFILEIKDNGIGIKESYINKMSKRFGLKNIEQRVKLLNGFIKRVSPKNKGTKYTIKIPLVLETVNSEIS